MDLRNPSEVTDDYWVAVKAVSPYCFQEVYGKWLLFVPVTNVDTVWRAVRDVVADGTVKAASAKVSTAIPNPNAGNPNTKVICVYASEDMRDEVGRLLMEVLPCVQDMKTIRFKTDDATMQGAYANRGDTKITCRALHWNNGAVTFT